MSHLAIDARAVGKRYRLGTLRGEQRTAAETLTRWLSSPLRVLARGHSGVRRGRKPDSIVDALDDVSFSVEHGEVVGIIGHNGAGKSTLLKVLSRITEPTSGSIDLFGRVGVLLEVGTGFHSELTGRENIYLNGAILGMRRQEVSAKLDAIVDFSGVERFLDTPVKFFSTGMELRLGFAVAAHLEPDILLVDEVLAVGDAEFQRKCLNKMDGIASEGRTVILVSHNMAAIAKLCHKTIWLERGRLMRYEETSSVISAYLSSVSAVRNVDVSARTDRRGQGPARLETVSVHGGDGAPTNIFPTGALVAVDLRYSSERSESLAEVLFTVRFYDQLRNLIFTLGNHLTGQPFLNLPHAGAVRAEIPMMPLVPGRYSLAVLIHVNGATSDHLDNVAELEIVDGDLLGGTIPMRPHVYGPVAVPHSWSR